MSAPDEGGASLSCAGETSAGEQAAGDRAAGESPAGVESAGDEPAGINVAGEVPAGEASSGGESPAGETTSGGETPAGETPAGESPAGEIPAGETPMGGDVAGESSAGEASAGEMSNETPAEASSAYDGLYFATFESEGLKSALAHVNIQGGLIEGDVMNRYGERITLGGFIDAQGVLRLPPLMGDMGSTFNAVGRVTRRGSIEGTFSVSGMLEREGSFAGSLNNEPIFRPSPAHDGLYQLSFVRGGSEVAATTMQIDQGHFSIVVVSATGSRFEARGFVSEDGTLALVGISPSEVLAEAYIDPDTQKIKGMYTIGRGEGTLVGDIEGSAAD